MSKELTLVTDSGETVYGVARVTSVESRGLWGNLVSGNLEAFNAANWQDYDIAITELGSIGIYEGSMPNVVASIFSVEVVYYRQLGASPAVSDTRIATAVYQNTNGWQLINLEIPEGIFGSEDETSGALTVISNANRRIHDWDSYRAQVQQLVSDTNDRTAIGFITPGGDVLVHMFAQGNASDAAEFFIREGPTVANNQGAMQPVINRRRDSLNTTGVRDTSQNPTAAGAATYFAEADQAHVTEDGTVIYQDLVSGEKKKGGGDSRDESEFILKPNTQYVFYMRSLNNNDNYHGLVLDWYET